MPWAVVRLVTVPAGLDRTGRIVGFLANDHDPLAHPDRAVPDPPDSHTSDIVVCREVRYEQLERMTFLISGRRRVLDQQFEERPEVGSRHFDVQRSRACLRVRVDDREVDLLSVRAKIHEQLVDGVEHLCGARIRAVDLVDGDDYGKVMRHRLLQHVARLRQRSLSGIDQQQNRVDHQQTALDLATEVGVTGGVDDVQADPVIVDGGLLGQDRDPLLALEVPGVHDPVHDHLVDSEGSGLAEHRVHEGGLAVVDVGNDGQVPDIGARDGTRRVLHGC
jgi:hypothetical protein